MDRTHKSFDILAQPDDFTCGPTCLQAVYGFYGDQLPLGTVIGEVPQLDTGGTLAVLLGTHALERGYQATLFTWDLDIFDPTWFEDGVDLPAKLRAQMAVKPGKRLAAATQAILRFIELGGEVEHREFEPELLRRQLKDGRPILTGLNATYLYGCAREREVGEGRMVTDDVRGRPQGHFVVVWEYDQSTRAVWLADPLRDNPLTGSHVYAIPVQRLMAAILLGMGTYDANFLVLEPPQNPGGDR